MFTLKLYRNGPLAPEGKTVILETAGLWVSECGEGMKRIQVFTKKVGVMDEDGGHDFYVGGKRTDEMTAVSDHNHYDWGVLENAQGKTTELFR